MREREIESERERERESERERVRVPADELFRIRSPWQREDKSG